MKTLSILGIVAAAAAGTMIVAPSSSSAMPVGGAQAALGATVGESMIVHVQSRRYRGARAYQYSAPRSVYRHNRGYHTGAAVLGGAVALGVLGAAATAAPGYYSECYLEQRPVVDQWGRYLGVQDVRVCY